MSTNWSLVATIWGQYLARPLKVLPILTEPSRAEQGRGRENPRSVFDWCSNNIDTKTDRNRLKKERNKVKQIKYVSVGRFSHN